MKKNVKKYLEAGALVSLVAMPLVSLSGACNKKNAASYVNKNIKKAEELLKIIKQKNNRELDVVFNDIQDSLAEWEKFNFLSEPEKKKVDQKYNDLYGKYYDYRWFYMAEPKEKQPKRIDKVTDFVSYTKYKILFWEYSIAKISSQSFPKDSTLGTTTEYLKYKKHFLNHLIEKVEIKLQDFEKVHHDIWKIRHFKRKDIYDVKNLPARYDFNVLDVYYNNNSNLEIAYYIFEQNNEEIKSKIKTLVLPNNIEKTMKPEYLNIDFSYKGKAQEVFEIINSTDYQYEKENFVPTTELKKYYYTLDVNQIVGSKKFYVLRANFYNYQTNELVYTRKFLKSLEPENPETLQDLKLNTENILRAIGFASKNLEKTDFEYNFYTPLFKGELIHKDAPTIRVKVHTEALLDENWKFETKYTDGWKFRLTWRGTPVEGWNPLVYY